MLEKLFESLDENVFTTELKESLTVSFNEAVELKAAVLADTRIDELEQKSEAHIDILTEKSEAHIDMLTEKSEEFVEMQQEELLESVDKYLDRAVEEFITEAKASLDDTNTTERADVVLEAFDSMIVAAGVDVARIVEAKDDTSADTKLAESDSKIDTLVDENILLIKENETLIKMGIISELSEGLTIIEQGKFKRLSEMVQFTKDESFVEKLETLKESVTGFVEEVATIKEKAPTVTLVESAGVTDYSHLV